jgi:3-dehydroquinate synthase II
VKTVWVNVDPWRKQLVLAALESGADAVLVPEGFTPKVKELGRLSTVAPDGDIKLGTDVVIMDIGSKDDEKRAAALPRSLTLILRMRDWTVIPLENLLAQRERLIVEVTSHQDAALVTQVLEKGADGVLITTDSPDEVRRTTELVHGLSGKVPLAQATITRLQPLGMGDRVCLDTCTEMKPGQGMLVGNTSGGFFLVHSETIETPYVDTRPFRVNAGGVHAYILAPEGKTHYLSELAIGDAVLVVGHDGSTETAYLGRCKVEKRPMMLVEGDADGHKVSLVLQNAETIRLTRPDGSAISVAALKTGDVVLAYLAQGGRHFGMKVQETLTER